MTAVGVIKFMAADSYFIYDAMSNAVVELPESAYHLIDTYLENGTRRPVAERAPPRNGDAHSDARDFLDECRDVGLFQPLENTRFGRPTRPEIDEALSSQLERLTLGATEQCNMRCTYCVFSGRFSSERSHSGAYMPWEVAKKSIDWYLARVREAPDEPAPSISFYGGEPVLRWDTIVRAVRYVEEHWALSKAMGVRFTLTTNGTLLSDERLDFLLEHGVFIYLSLDGPASIHDTGRRMPNDTPTHAIVLDVVRRIAARRPNDVKRHVAINCTVDPRNNILDVARFFAEHGMADLTVMSNRLNPHGSKDFHLSEAERQQHLRNVELLTDDFFAALKNHDAAFCFAFFKSTLRNVFFQLPDRRIGPPPRLMTPAAICIPGCSKLFVDVRGRFNACENFYYGDYAIGDVEHGFDVDAIIRLMDWWVAYAQDHCRSCWAFRLCQLCYFAAVDERGHLNEETLAARCEHHRTTQRDGLARFVTFWRREEAEGIADHPESLHSTVHGLRQQSPSTAGG